MSYALASYGLVVAAVLAYAAGLWRTRRRLAEAPQAGEAGTGTTAAPTS